MDRRRFLTFIIIWFVVILVWLLFCYGEVRDAYYSWDEITQSFLVTNISSEVVETTEKEPEKLTDYNKNTDYAKNPDYTKNSDSDDENKELQKKMSETKSTENIRVVLLNDTGDMFHDEITLGCNDETLKLTENTSFFKKTDKIRIGISNPSQEGIAVLSINKPYGNPVYEGTLEVHKTEEGFVLINELPLENYVKGVLPGEMSSGFPMEALKAQAVCARTYAVMKMKEPAYSLYNAAVDDSISSQVYMFQERNEKSDQAVEETKSELLYNAVGTLENCYYYSTSCGKHATEEVWDIQAIKEKGISASEETESEFKDFISRTIDSHLEKEEPFYRWTYETDVTSDALYQKCLERNLCTEDYGKIKHMKIVCRENGGAAQCMEVVCEEGSFYVMGEYNIRFVLSQGGNVTLQNGKTYDTGELLPSAFLAITCTQNKKGHIIGYEIQGGGFGHGIGMSQNGAKYMAKAGNNYIEILQTYYKGSYIN